MKGKYTKSNTKHETVATVLSFGIYEALCGRRFDSYELFYDDIEVLVKLAQEDPDLLRAKLEHLLTRMPPKEKGSLGPRMERRTPPRLSTVGVSLKPKI